MKSRHVLLLNVVGLTAYRSDGERIVLEAQFPADGGGFDAYLESRRHEGFALLADVPDESFEFERLPHVRGRSGKALMKRKRERHCHGSPLCAALPQGRQSEGRRDDQILFAALSRPQIIEPWLRRLQQAQAPLSGVYSLPQVIADFAANRAAGSFILATVGRGGLRQTFVAEGHLRFSRLTPLSSSTIEEIAAACAAEAANMRRYLCGQRLVDRDAPLPVLALLHPAEIGDFRRYCRDDAELWFDCLDIVAEAARRGFAGALPDSRSDALFVHLLAKRPPRLQFAGKAVRFQWRLLRLRRAIEVFGWSALTASVLFAGVQLPGLLRVREAAAELEARNDADERAYRVSLQQPDPRSPPPALSELAAAMETLARTSPGPAPMLNHLSRALDEVPSIELESLDWQIVGELEQVEGPFAVLQVHGACADGDPQRQQRSVERLVERLRSDSVTRATVLQQPSVLVSSQTIRSADVSKSDGAFVLHLAQRL